MVRYNVLMKAVVYARVSTKDTQSPEAQVSLLEEYVRVRGWSLTETCVDHGLSGASSDRPGLKRVLFLAEARQIDVIIVLKLDRFFRSLKHMVGVLDLFQSLGVQFVSLRDSIDWTTPSGRFFTQILASFAEFEREMIRERTLIGLEFAKKKGTRLGRPKSVMAAMVIPLLERGLGHDEIRQQLGISRSTLWRELKRVSKTPQNL